MSRFSTFSYRLLSFLLHVIFIRTSNFDEAQWCAGHGAGGPRFPLRRAFQGTPKQHWGASYEAGNSVVLLCFACPSPIILTRTTDHVKLSARNERRMLPSANWH